MEEKLKGKEAVKTTIDADGNLVLSYGADSRKGQVIAKILVPIVSIIGLIITILIALGTNGSLFGIFLGVAFFVGLILAFCFVLIRRREKLIIVKGKGIKFQKQELPFSSIDQLFTFFHDGGYTVKARVRGREVSITRGVREMVAREVVSKILSNSDGILSKTK